MSEPRGYIMSRPTAERVTELVRQQGGEQQSFPARGGSAGHSMVLISASDSAFGWIGTVYQLDSITGGWVTYDTEARVKEVNDQPLEIGWIYPCFQYGLYEDTSSSVWTTYGGRRGKCGVKLDDDGKLKLDLEGFLGDGFELSEPDENGCKTLEIKAACGIETSGDGIGIKRADLFGTDGGLEADGESGCKIKIKGGCGTIVDSDGISVDLLGMIDPMGGLAVTDSTDADCSLIGLHVPTCSGLIVDDTGVSVDVLGILDPVGGLAITTGTEGGCSKISVKTSVDSVAT